MGARNRSVTRWVAVTALAGWLAGGARLGAQILEGGTEVGGDWGQLLWFEGDGAGLNTPYNGACAGDVNRDGHDDLILGAAGSDWGTWGYVEGGAVVVSGRDGAALFTFRGQYPPDEWFGAAVDGAGDADGDGSPDFLIGSPNANSGPYQGAGLVYVYSGWDGSLVRVHQSAPNPGLFGRSLGFVGDVNRDGLEDCIVGAPTVDFGAVVDAGAAYLYSGSDGSLLLSWHGTTSLEWFGDSVSGAGDVDLDGCPDVLVGALAADPGGRSGAGQAWVFSGRDGAPIWVFDGVMPGDGLGGSVAGVGDLDGDGHADIAAGASGEDTASHQVAGAVYAFSGATGSLLWKVTGRSYDEYLGQEVAGIGDLDDDGVPEVLAGAPQYDYGVWQSMAGRAYVLSGRDGRILHVFQGDRFNLQVGAGVADAGDVDADGRREILIGLAGWSTPVGLGAVAVYDFNPCLFLSSDTISASSGQPVTAAMDFDLWEAGRRYALLASGTGTGPTTLGGVEVPLERDRLLDAMLAGWAPPLLRGAFGTLDANGDATAQVLSHPALQRWVGRTFWLAALSYDPLLAQGRISSVARALAVVP